MAEQDEYFAQFAIIAQALGADPVPTSRIEAQELVSAMRLRLLSDTRTREVARIVLDQPAPTRAAAPMQRMMFQAAVDLLPDWACTLHGLRISPTVGVARMGASGLSAAVRWAFATN